MFKVYAKNEEERGKKKELLFKLEEDYNCLRLILVDKDGDRIPHGNILTIEEDGLHLISCVTEDAPFKLGRDECIALGESY